MDNKKGYCVYWKWLVCLHIIYLNVGGFAFTYLFFNVGPFAAFVAHMCSELIHNVNLLYKISVFFSPNQTQSTEDIRWYWAHGGNALGTGHVSGLGLVHLLLLHLERTQVNWQGEANTFTMHACLCVWERKAVIFQKEYHVGVLHCGLFSLWEFEQVLSEIFILHSDAKSKWSG